MPLKMLQTAASDDMFSQQNFPNCGRTDLAEQGGFFKSGSRGHERIISNSGRFVPALFVLLCLLFSDRIAAQSTDAAEHTRMSLLDDERTIQVGNRLSYSVDEDRERPSIILVNTHGEVGLPLIGKVKAEGKTCRKLAHEIKSLLEVDFYYQATVLIDFPQYAENLGEAILLGEVQRPGSLQIPVDEILTVSDAVLGAGGFTRDADAEKVTLIRGDPEGDERQEFPLDVGKMFATGNFEGDMEVRSGDYIRVPKLAQAGGQFYIWGEVLRPGSYDIPSEKDFTLSKAIFLAGGFSTYANKRKVELVRSETNLAENEDKTIVVNVQAILEEGLRSLDPVVKPDDIIRVKERRFMIQ